RKL
ncbi:prolipoprotein signal peptidase II, partial [Escherichia coli EC1865]